MRFICSSHEIERVTGEEGQTILPLKLGGIGEMMQPPPAATTALIPTSDVWGQHISTFFIDLRQPIYPRRIEPHATGRSFGSITLNWAPPSGRLAATILPPMRFTMS